MTNNNNNHGDGFVPEREENKPIPKKRSFLIRLMFGSGRFSLSIMSILFGLFTFGLISICIVAAAVYWYFSKDLPSYQELSDYRPPVISRVYASDGSLIGQFAKERRLFTPIENIPTKVSHAFIAAEDKNFYNHPGVDFMGITRAMLSNIANIGSGRRMQGASTITQQVMKNFLLQDEQAHVRKIKEAILATRFEGTFSKEHILELYLNEIFLGAGTYGVTSAAQTYFDKKLSELEIEEIAFLAGLPKGPNNYHPLRQKERAVTRRNYVLKRMYEDEYITEAEYNKARNKPLVTVLGTDTGNLDATYFVEEIRRDLLSRYGESVLYNSGLMVTSTINPQLQRYAEKALRMKLMEYDRSKGWRGAIANVDLASQKPLDILQKYKTPKDLYDWRIALVTNVSTDQANIFIKETKSSAVLPVTSMRWAYTKENPRISSADQVLKVGDVIYVSQDQANNNYNLMQIPAVNGAFMVMEPHTGRVLAQQGGFSFSASQFNRATQARRQPGSSFKPFVYAAALEMGYSPSTLIYDGPFYYVDDLGRPWEPENYDKKYLGNIPMRVGLRQSRNLMTIRIAQDVGMENVVDFANRLGVGDKMKPYLPMSLGAGEVTLEKMVTAYATFANGGYKVSPIYFDRVQNRDGKTILTADIPTCLKCVNEKDQELISKPIRIIDPVANYQMVSMLEDVVQNGTGRTLKSLGVPIAGKTGTTNESKDAWFIGFTSNLVFGTYIGYDNPIPMGKRVTGGGTAAPLVKTFLEKAIKITETSKFMPPSKATMERVNNRTGEVVKSVGGPIYNNNNDGTTVEVYKEGQKPQKNWYKKEEFKTSNEKDYYKKEHLREVEDNINIGTGGLY